MAGEMQRYSEGLLHYKHLVLKKTIHKVQCSWNGIGKN